MNDYNEDDLKKLKDIKCKYIIICKVIGDNEVRLRGYIYYQGSGKTFTGVKRDVGDKAHIEPAKERPVKSKMHCSNGGLVIFENSKLPQREKRQNEVRRSEVKTNVKSLKPKFDDDKYVCATKAKQDFFLSVTDLLKVPFVKSASQKLYNRDDIQAIVSKKYGSDDPTEILKILKHKREKRIAIRQAKSQQRQEQRHSHLRYLLSQSGLELRDDSTLCQRYIRGEIKEQTPEWIVNRMCQLKYLYQYLDMKKAYKESRKLKAEQPDYPQSISQLAEHIALRKVGGSYPDKFPWL